MIYTFLEVKDKNKSICLKVKNIFIKNNNSWLYPSVLSCRLKKAPFSHLDHLYFFTMKMSFGVLPRNCRMIVVLEPCGRPPDVSRWLNRTTLEAVRQSSIKQFHPLCGRCCCFRLVLLVDENTHLPGQCSFSRFKWAYALVGGLIKP